MSIDHLAQHALDHPERIALIDDRAGGETRVWTYSELNEETNALAHGLRGRGYGPGDTVMWCGANSAEVFMAMHATRKIGATSVPLPYRLTPEEAAFIVDDSGSTVLLIDAASRVLIDESRHPNLREVVVFGEQPAGTDLGWNDLLGATDELVDSSDVPTPLMIYTSGTTGRPKGAVRRVGGPANQFGALLELLGWRNHELRFLVTGPLYHSGPSGFALRAMLVGGTVVIQRTFDAEDWLRLVQQHRITATFSAPTPVRRITALPDAVKARYDTSSMRSFVANAAPWTQALKEAYVADFPADSLWEVYGSTELSICTVMAPDGHFAKPGSCGKPAPGVEIRLYDDDGEVVTAADTPGELFVRSAGVFETYHNAPERFAEDHRDGFQTVGDIAFVDSDGYYTICDRKKDMIISGGVNVYPAEVENILDAHPDVVEVSVIGTPDPEWGEVVCAVMIGRDGIDVDAVRAFARERLAGYKTPKRIELVDELPMTGTGKVLKRELRQRFS